MLASAANPMIDAARNGSDHQIRRRLSMRPQIRHDSPKLGGAVRQGFVAPAQ